jgi:GAF domain-containing protein/HAMP domain-containing protein
MQRSDLSSTLFGRALLRTGKLFLPAAAAFAQLVPYLFIIPAAFFIQNNADFTKSQGPRLILATLITCLVAALLLVVWVYYFYSLPRQRINLWLRGEPLPTATNDETRAWQEITAMPWQFGIASAITFLLIVIAPVLAYLYFALKASRDQLLYSLIGGIIAASIIVSLGILILERLLTPANQILLPARSETQLSAAAGANIFTKLQVITFFLILISVLLVAPIGYHITVAILFNGIIGPEGALRTLQIQTVIAGIVTLVLGVGLSLLLSRSVSDPLHRLIDTFRQVEQGDLKARARVTSADEVGTLTVHFNRMITRLDELTANLEKQVADRTIALTAATEDARQRATQMETVSKVARAIAQLTDVKELLPAITRVISQDFGYYHVGIFLLDANKEFAVLSAANSEGGQRMLGRGHKLRVGQTGMVGYVADHAEPRISLDVGEDAVYFDNPDLPGTRSEMSLPLKVGERLIGVLDVQSEQASAFTKQDIEVMTTLADQVAIAIENANLFGETQRALTEAQVSYGQYLHQAWERLPTETQTTGYQYSGAAIAPLEKPVDLPEIRLAVKSGKTVPPSKQEPVLAVPLKLRGEVIGVLDIRPKDASRVWNENELALVQAIADRAAIALENARLFEETTRRADRERVVSEITTRIRSTNDPGAMLQIAMEELRQVLGAGEIQIRAYSPGPKDRDLIKPGPAIQRPVDDRD